MDTINSLAQTASNAIFGQDQNKQEPISGVKGNTAEGEPYDAGNMDPPPNGSKETTSSTANPAKQKPSTQQVIDSSKQQADTRHPDNPETTPGTSTEKNDVDNKKDERPDVKGPGPRPLDVVAKERGGDAGNSDTSLDKTADGSGLGGKPTEVMGQTIHPMVSPAPHNGTSPSGRTNGTNEGDDGVQRESHGKGTGEKWEKSTGLASEGGDFDASRPGAGREADRILEAKGIKKSDSPGNSDTTPGKEDSVGDTPEKKSLKEKLKEKLHTH